MNINVYIRYINVAENYSKLIIYPTPSHKQDVTQD